MIVCSMYTHRFALHPLGGQRAGGNSRATAKSFEPGIHNLPLVVHLNLSKQRFVFVFIFFRVLLKCQCSDFPKNKRGMLYSNKLSCSCQVNFSYEAQNHNHIAAVIFTI